VTNGDQVAKVATQHGRTLTYLEVGDPDGPLVVHNRGGPSSRLEARLFADCALRNRLRLICVDRPDIGQSSPQTTRAYSGWAGDVTRIADTLGYREFGVTGRSEGGPWALAAAAYIDPRRLRHVSSIAGGSYGTFGDNWAANHLSKADAFGGLLALRFKPGFHLMYAAIGLVAKNFRFDVTAIERRVHMWQGTDDRLVAAPINKTVADRMPGAVWHPVEGAGHFVAIGSADEVLRIAPEELAA